MAVLNWGSEQLIGTTDNDPGAKDADVAGLADGGYIVVWEDDSAPQHIHFLKFDAAGNQNGLDTLIPEVPNPSAEIFQPQVAGLADGGFFVGLLFRIDSGAPNLNLERYPSDAQTSSGFDVAPGDDAAVATFENNLLMSYRSSSDDIFALAIEANGFTHRFTAAGNVDKLMLNSDATDGVQDSPAIAWIDNGQRFVATWFDHSLGGNYVYRVFDIDGTPITGSLYVNNTLGVSSSTGLASVVGLESGGFVIVWGEFSTALQDTDVSSIHAQIYDRNGAEVGAEFVVNSNFRGAQAFPDVTALPNGGFAAVWSDASAGGGVINYNIEGQVFDAFGARVGSQFIVNTSSENSEEFDPHISALADGRLVVEWHSYNPAGTDFIRTQIIDPRDGVVTGTESADKLYGNDLGDQIKGLGGNDTEFGLKGGDSLYGGDGNDFLKGGQGDDTLYGGAGIDTASYADKTVAVVVTLAGAHEAVVMVGGIAEDSLFQVENVTGGSKSDNLTGDDIANVLNGFDGNDVLRGRGGNDTLHGGNGIDKLTGGAGLDKLNGGAGDDTFIYTALADSGATALTRDQITGFASGDKIDLHLIDAIAGGADNAFVLDSGGSFAAGEIRQTVVGSDVRLDFNVDADSTPEMSILLLNRATFLTEADFVL